MATPVSELIALELETRLNLLTVEGDYETFVSEVIRPTRFGTWTPLDLQIVLTQSSPEVDEAMSRPGNPPATAYRLTFNIRCHVITDENSADTYDSTCNQFAADVVKAVCVAGTDWYTFDDNAYDASFETLQNIVPSGGIGGVNVPLVVMFRTDEGNPYNVRAC